MKLKVTTPKLSKKIKILRKFLNLFFYILGFRLRFRFISKNKIIPHEF